MISLLELSLKDSFLQLQDHPFLHIKGSALYTMLCSQYAPCCAIQKSSPPATLVELNSGLMSQLIESIAAPKTPVCCTGKIWSLDIHSWIQVPGHNGAGFNVLPNVQGITSLLKSYLHKNASISLLQCFSPQLPDWNSPGHSSIWRTGQTRSTLNCRHPLFDSTTSIWQNRFIQQKEALQMWPVHWVVWKHVSEILELVPGLILEQNDKHMHDHNQKPGLTV